MKDKVTYPRFIQSQLLESIADSPAVLIHGSRQCGKSTLARMIGGVAGYSYLSFDDDVIRSAAKSDPIGFIADLGGKTIIDEVQRVPELFTSIKAAIDRDRTPGRFILTGSSNLLLIPDLSDSLAGRMEIIRLYPLSQAELLKREGSFIDDLLHCNFKFATSQRMGRELVEKVVAGGYPAALMRATPQRSAIWYRDYVETVVKRDARNLARISSIDSLARLMLFAAAQTATLLNVSDLAAPFQLSRPTIREYLTVLSNLFLLEELQPWHSNRMSRLIKTPKLHLADTGIAAALLGLDTEALLKDRAVLGHLLETFLFQELRRQASWHEEAVQFYHFRDKDAVEVDMILDVGGRKLAGVEVKASATVTNADFRGLRKLQSGVADRFVAGVVLYDGETTVSFGERLFAVPIRRVWEG